MAEQASLEGWIPEIGSSLTLERVIDLAFDYRGNVTIVRADGTETIGYVSNRDARAAYPFVELFDERGDGPFKLRYGEIANIKFTGKDTAAGKSWEAWVARRDKEKAEAVPPGEP